MCMVAILFRVIEGCPVLIAANREEYNDRQGTPPELWPGEPAFVAGRDPRAGGTWFGVNEYGVVAAVTNRQKFPLPDTPRSRGLLCRDLLGSTTAREAHARALDQLDHEPYAGCNVIVIDAAAAYVIVAGIPLRSVPLPAGMHVVTAQGLNDASDRRGMRARDWLASRKHHTTEGWLKALPQLLSDHGQSQIPPICLHGQDRGTLSSSLVALPDRPRDARLLHAQGPPCTHAYSDCSNLLVSILQRA
jgi:uncharacterized protein with NRDE domain